MYADIQRNNSDLLLDCFCPISNRCLNYLGYLVRHIAVMVECDSGSQKANNSSLFGKNDDDDDDGSSDAEPDEERTPFVGACATSITVI